ncbi:hypothetical protein E7X38_13850 [Streptomyces sp. Akac8]|nr:hypothetical protein E7X38_13850 [Streptomyces sp. Akac8]
MLPGAMGVPPARAKPRVGEGGRGGASDGAEVRQPPRPAPMPVPWGPVQGPLSQVIHNPPFPHHPRTTLA